VGLIVGLVIALALAFGPFDFVVAGKVWGLHPGLYGLVANTAIATAGSAVGRPRAEDGRPEETAAPALALGSTTSRGG
jgi:hypothetical protein